MPAVAIVASAVIGAVVANSAAKKQQRAADRATDLAREQGEQARTDQMRMYEQRRTDEAPYREAAQPSIQNMAKGLEDGGEYSRSFGMGDFDADPGRLYRLSQGEQGINRAAAARGGWNSGATLKALARFNSDQASQEYGAAYSRFNTDRTTKFNRHATMAGYGQTANSAIGNAGTNAVNQMTSAGQNSAFQQGRSIQDAAESRASGYVGMANNIGSGIRQWYNNDQQNGYMGAGNYGNRSIYDNFRAQEGDSDFVGPTQG